MVMMVSILLMYQAREESKRRSSSTAWHRGKTRHGGWGETRPWRQLGGVGIVVQSRRAIVLTHSCCLVLGAVMTRGVVLRSVVAPLVAGLATILAPSLINVVTWRVYLLRHEAHKRLFFHPVVRQAVHLAPPIRLHLACDVKILQDDVAG